MVTQLILLKIKSFYGLINRIILAIKYCTISFLTNNLYSLRKEGCVFDISFYLGLMVISLSSRQQSNFSMTCLALFPTKYPFLFCKVFFLWLKNIFTCHFHLCLYFICFIAIVTHLSSIGSSNEDKYKYSRQMKVCVHRF